MIKFSKMCDIFVPVQPSAGLQGWVPVQREVVQAGQEGARHDQLLHLHAQQTEQEADQAQATRDQCSGECLGLPRTLE